MKFIWEEKDLSYFAGKIVTLPSNEMCVLAWKSKGRENDYFLISTRDGMQYNLGEGKANSVLALNEKQVDPVVRYAPISLTLDYLFRK